MIGHRVGVAGTLVAALALLPSCAQQTQAPLTTAAKTTHSIKITLSDGEKGCEIKSISPETPGVYPDDSVIWNVESTCKTDAKVTIGEVRQVEPKEAQRALFVDGEKWQGTVQVPAGSRAQFGAHVSPTPFRSDDPHHFRYDITVRLEPPNVAPPSKLSPVCCARPPCPPTP
jgi:hypothetical protein